MLQLGERASSYAGAWGGIEVERALYQDNVFPGGFGEDPDFLVDINMGLVHICWQLPRGHAGCGRCRS
jgi:hypothetical protein